MCFAPQADAVAGTLLLATGAYTISQTRSRKLLPLASIPAVFGLHQLSETFVWTGLRGEETTSVYHAALYFFLTLSYLLPTFIPLALFFSEGRKKSYFLIILAGVISSLMLLSAITVKQPSACVVGHYVSYSISSPTFYIYLATGLYIIATCVPLLLSSDNYLRVYGAANLVVVAALVLIMRDALVSLWCAWASVTSVAILLYIKRRATYG